MTVTPEAPRAAREAPTGRVVRRVRTPTVLQMETTECGAACLSIVLAHYGRWAALEELRTETGVSRDGAKAGNIARAARTYGLDATGLRMEPGGLADVTLPVIVHWNFNHFVVVEGYGPRGVDLNDPAVGPRRVSWAEFDESFTGIAITLEPNASFEQGGERPSLLAGLQNRFVSAAGAIWLCVLAGIGLLVPGLFVPGATRIFVNEVLGTESNAWLGVLIGGVALAAIAQLALTALQQLTLLRLSTRLSVSMSARFIEHVLRLPIAFFSQRHAGHIATRIEANDEIARLLSSDLATAVLAMFTSTFYLVIMFVYSWPLALVTLLFVALNAFTLRWASRRQRDANLRLVHDAGRLVANGAVGVSSIETLKATGGEAAFFARWAGLQAKVLAGTEAIGVQLAAVSAIPILLVGLGTSALIGVGGIMVMSGTLSLGTLVAFQMLAAGFALPVAQLIGLGPVIQRTAASLASIEDVLSHPLDPAAAAPGGATIYPKARTEAERAVDRERRAVSSKLAGVVELRDLTFGYSPLERALIDGLELRIEPGQRVAIVGPSGSGKSTVARLIAGLNAPWRGEVLIDGTPRKRIPRDAMAASLSFVDQDIHLLRGTVRDNITLWDPTVDEDAVVRAARDAQIYGDIVAREGGFERAIDADGLDWSGGQRQRIEIARALASDPSVLILDEATSALDPILEHRIDQAIRARGCTTILVAHRLSTIRDADEIIVLDHGTVAERGTHERLMALDGLYTDLIGD